MSDPIQYATPASHSTVSANAAAPDRWPAALGMAITAILVGIAIHVKDGQYDPPAIQILSLGLFSCVLGIVLPRIDRFDSTIKKCLIATLVVGILLNVGLLAVAVQFDTHLLTLIFVVAALAMVSLLNMRGIKHIAMAIIIVGYLLAFGHAFKVEASAPSIDVYEFQQDAAEALKHGHDPYAIRFANLYNEDQTRMFYGPGVVKDGMVDYGFPYPPLSLLMIMPGYLLGGDCRYAHLVAIAISIALMAYARPGRLGILAAAMFLLTPRQILVLDFGWTEPVLLLNFSLTMFCACRWKKALPYALGLFFATKQYSVLAVPAVVLLIDGPSPWRQLWQIMLKAGLVATAITLPFFLWNPHEFWRAVVAWQFVQPFRIDALSYLVWLRRENLAPWIFSGPNGLPRMWIPFVGVILAASISLWRCVRSPAGFAAAVTLVLFIFFALNKQAFCNYYFFVVATACWGVAAMQPPRLPARSHL